MGKRLGIISGAGDFPLYVCEEVKRQNNICIVAAIKGFAGPSIEEKADIIGWFGMDEIFELISFLKKNNVREALFAGKIDPRVIYKKEDLAPAVIAMMEKGRDKNPVSLLNTAIGFLGSQGITIIDPSPFLSSVFCDAGLLTEAKPPANIEADMTFGWTVARQIADMDIGQTVVIKDKAVVAVEGMEGTDEAIKRGGLLAGRGTTVIKVSRTHQDSRVDLPAVGLNTVKSLIEAKSAILCVEAKRVLFFQKEEAIALANANDIVLFAKST